MKLYLADGTYYEKQADVPKGTKFKPVEFPFAASPKADFVAWMNQLDYGPGVSTRIAEPDLMDKMAENVFGKPQPAPVQPDPAHAAQKIAFEDAFEAMPLATKLHYAALAVEEARDRLP